MKYEKLLNKTAPLPTREMIQKYLEFAHSRNIRRSGNEPIAEIALLLTHSANVLPKALEALKTTLAQVANTDTEHIWLNAPNKPEVSLGSVLRDTIQQIENVMP